MCGRYSETVYKKEIVARFKCQIIEGDFSARYNIAPMQEAPVVISNDSRILKLMQWCPVPSWAKDATIGYKMINARAETLTQKPSFSTVPYEFISIGTAPSLHFKERCRKSFESRRCLVTADGFYEWRKVDGNKIKIPTRIVLKSREPFAVAGLWDTWQKPDGSELYSFTIITTESISFNERGSGWDQETTTEPNELMRPIHNRMPAILQQQNEEMWLDPDFKDSSKLSKFLAPYPEQEMESYEVSSLVNSPGNDSPQCVIPADYNKSLKEQ